MANDDFYNELKEYREEIESLEHKEQKKLVTKLKYKLSKKYKISKLPTDIQILLNTGIKIKTKPTRTNSGVTVVAIMTKPLPCPHALNKGVGPCLMCPGGQNSFYGDVPQSYTGNEPATMRAIRNNYDPYLQVFNRLEQYVAIGQNLNKIELIIMGGTFPSYDIDYQNEFVMYALKAMNDFSKLFINENNTIKFKKYLEFFEMPSDMKNEGRIKRIKEKVLELKNKNCDNKKENSLEFQKKYNEHDSRIKCIAMVIETRPDYAKEEQIINMINQGCTRVEIGVQTIDDKKLEFLRRGHNNNDAIISTRLMKDSLLKVGYHMMIGVDKRENEINMFKELFENQDYRPDAIKIYPMLVIQGTKLYELYKEGKFIPTETNEAVEIIGQIKKFIPKYVRIMRIQRDIPHTEVIAGVKKTNLRQYVLKYTKEHHIECQCIRCQEIKDKLKIDISKIKYEKLFYEASKGQEVFISALYENKLVGFLRLRKLFKPFINELKGNTAGIREVHVYGQSLTIGKKSDLSGQHKGIGKTLMKLAQEISFNEWKCDKIAVISGIGVRNYYRKLGYKLIGNYMIKKNV